MDLPPDNGSDGTVNPADTRRPDATQNNRPQPQSPNTHNHATVAPVVDARGRKRLFRKSKPAKIQGTFNSRLEWPLRDGHTSFTPLPPGMPRDMDLNGKLMNYFKQLTQKYNTNGWTTKEMAALDAVVPYPRYHHRAPTSDCGLHPLVEKSRWRTSNDLGANEAFIPIGMGCPGNYEADNQIIWTQLQPSLRMVSNMLYAAEDSQWFSAFLDGRTYHTEGLHSEHEPWRAHFYSRTGPTNPMEKARIARKLVELAPYLKLEVGVSESATSGSKLAREAGLSQDPQDWTVAGCSVMWTRPGRHDEKTPKYQALITLSYRHFYYLLFGQFDERQRVASQYAMASTIMHEICHGLFVAMSVLDQLPYRAGNVNEPYHNKEVLAELGWSMEYHFLGALHSVMTSPPLFASNSREWPLSDDLNHNKTYKKEEKTSAAHWLCSPYFPVPVIHYYSLLSQEFWNTRNALGGRLLHRAPLVLGRIFFQYNPHHPNLDISRHLHPAGFKPEYLATTRGREFVQNRYGRDGYHRQYFQALEAAFNLASTDPVSIKMERWVKEWFGDGGELQKALSTTLEFNNSLYELPGEEDDFEWEEGPIQEPARFQHIWSAVHHVRKRCRLDTMKLPRPAHTVLYHINKVLQEDNQPIHFLINVEEWHQFLEYVASRGWLFKYQRYKESVKKNNCPPYVGLEWMTVIDVGWDKSCKVLEPRPLPPFHMTPEVSIAVYHFRAFMKLLSHKRIWHRRYRLAKHGLSTHFFRPGEDQDYDLVTMNSLYNLFVKRQSDRMSEEDRANWSGYPHYLGLSDMYYLFAQGHIPNWGLGFEGTVRYIGGGPLLCDPDELGELKKRLDTYASEEAFLAERRKWADAAALRARVRCEKDEAKKRALFIMLEQVKGKKTGLQDVSAPPARPPSGPARNTNVNAWRAFYLQRKDKLKEAKHTAVHKGKGLDPNLINLSDAEAFIRKQRQQTAAEQARHKQIENELNARFGAFMGSSWLPYQPLALSGKKPFVAKVKWDELWGLQMRIADLLAEETQYKSDAEIAQFSWDRRSHICFLRDMLKIVDFMAAVSSTGWGSYVPDQLTGVSAERKALVNENYHAADDFVVSPEWFADAAGVKKLLDLMKWRKESYQPLPPLGETEVRKWERELGHAWDKPGFIAGAARPGQGGAARPIDQGGARRGVQLPHRSERQRVMPQAVMVEGESEVGRVARPAMDYDRTRGRQQGRGTKRPGWLRDERSRSPVAKRQARR